MKPLTTEPPLDPPETVEDRRDAVQSKLYRTLQRLQGHLVRDDEVELELQHMACQARDDDEIVFVEVKTAFKTNPDLLDEKVDKDKLKKISHAIYQYQKETEQIDDIRIDCISVILQKKKPIIKHFEGIRLE